VQILTRWPVGTRSVCYVAPDCEARPTGDFRLITNRLRTMAMADAIVWTRVPEGARWT
jgi:hypothetical protein